MAKDAYYFSHDSNARNDPKCSALIDDYGAEGYGIFWMLIEILAEQENYKLRKFNKLYSGLGRQILVDTDRLRIIIEAMLQDYELLVQDENYIWSESLLRRMEVKDAKRQVRVEAGRKGGINSGITRSKETQIKQNEALLEANEPKESKVKESKKKESKDNDLPTTISDAIKIFSNNIHPITPIEAEQLAAYIEDGFDATVLIYAVKQAVLAGVRKMTYINGILKDLKKAGILTMEAVEAAERDYQDKKNGKQKQTEAVRGSNTYEPDKPPDAEQMAKNQEFMKGLLGNIGKSL